MQKKLIALAVAGLVTAPAFAQSNVTIYGRADYGFMSRTGTPDGFPSNTDVNGKVEFASGVQAGSRIGFKGAEDLGNGLKAIFEIEYGLAMDQGTNASTQWGNRHSYVGLTGNWGTAVGGRLDGVRYNVWGKYDPFANGTVGNMTELTPQVDRADNAVAYISPSFSGLTVTLAYSTNIAGTEGANNLTITPIGVIGGASCPANAAATHCSGGNNGDNRLYTAMLSYDNGPLSLTGDYEEIKTVGVSNDRLWVATFGASYDFNVVKISALYDKVKSDKQNTVLGLWDQKTWMLAAKAPIGPSIDVRAAYADTKYDDAAGQKVNDFGAKKFGVGADYKFSKRTNAYLDYGQIDNDKNGLTELTYAGSQFGLTSPAAYGTRGFDIGLAHKF